MASIINATTTNGVAVQGDNSGSLQLQTNNGTTAVTIDTSQNVGIGTSSPNSFFAENDSKLTVGTGSGNSGITIYTGNTSQGGIYFADGTTGAETYSGILRYNHSSNAMLFYTNGLNERMRITSGGALLVGCTSEPNNTVNGFKADNNYTIIAGNDQIPFYVNRNSTTGEIQQLRYNNGAVGNISTNGSNCTFNSTSDYRLKENITPMTDALAKVAQLKPVTYTWKKDGQNGEGFIAHELAEVCPEAVTGEKDAVDEDGKPVYQAIDQSVLVATLTAAIQELKAELDATKAEVQALKGAA